jgi:hypothetical protein
METPPAVTAPKPLIIGILLVSIGSVHRAIGK